MKLVLGRPIRLTLRDDVSDQEFKSVLQQGGVLYVRDDVFQPPPAGKNS